MAGYKLVKPADAHVIAAEVVRSVRVTPAMVRLTVGGQGMDLFTPMGFDQWFRLFLPSDEQDALRLPTAASSLWYAQYLSMPRAQRPHVRNYTVRAFRPEQRELDIDVVVHGDAGPGSSFALRAEAGQPVGLLDQGIGFNPRVEHDWTLLVADESGLAAVAGVCESLPADAVGLALVEVPAADDVQDFRVPAGIELRWLPREGPGAPPDGAEGLPGQLALRTLRSAALPEGRCYGYLVGESAMVTGGRRHLVADRCVPKANVDFVGYWRHGRAAA